FDSGPLDTTKWNYLYGYGCQYGICGWGNEEIQYYTDRQENIRVDSGLLVIEAREEPVDSALLARYPEYTSEAIPGGNSWKVKPRIFKHTSARITTKGKGDWTFGKVEVRAKIPDGGDGAGIWPAIWMLPTHDKYGHWPQSGEIDIMEAYGPNMDTVHQTFHWWSGEGEWQNYMQSEKVLNPMASWADSFHVYGLVWTQEKAILTIDGREKVTRENQGSTRLYPYLDEFHLIMNIAVGGGALRGRQTFGLTRFPQTMQVDWVRVYRNRNLQAKEE
ncbi:MAG TPA: glycoside hydrolase family 16 protein, partial [Fibrobacteria bacterium]|nr:glycoside hydrolase family 16 protein [Fibrobacteria bacterium]